MRNSEQIAK